MKKILFLFSLFNITFSSKWEGLNREIPRNFTNYLRPCMYPVWERIIGRLEMCESLEIEFKWKIDEIKAYRQIMLTNGEISGKLMKDVEKMQAEITQLNQELSSKNILLSELKTELEQKYSEINQLKIKTQQECCPQFSPHSSAHLNNYELNKQSEMNSEKQIQDLSEIFEFNKVIRELKPGASKRSTRKSELVIPTYSSIQYWM
jgi:DNA repair exonuclease SbcCD ATPase subunit